MAHPESLDKQTFLDSLEVVKTLKQTEFETYKIVKQRGTDRHYLQYSFFHIALAEGGRREDHSYFLPLASDDVLAIVLGEQPYEYPEHWKQLYYRTEADQRILPFDPRANFVQDADEQEANEIVDALLRYKQAWANAVDKEALTQQLFSQLAQIERRHSKREE